MRTKIFLAFMVCVSILNAQTTLDDIGRITIQAYQPEYENIPCESTELIKNKLSQIITSHGIADNDFCERFILTAKINVISKDIVVGPPQRISQKIEVVFIIGDIIADKIYATTTIQTVGIGTNLNKSFISAFRNINPRSANIIRFIEEGKRKIVDYYSSNCAIIIKEAQKLANLQNYDEALHNLISVPNICEECYHECSKLSVQIYKEMIDSEGLFLLNTAKATWAKQPNSNGAEEIIKIISQININASCQPQIQLFIQSINEKLVNDEKRKWEFKMQQYKDQVAREKREWEQRIQEYKDLQEKEKEEREFVKKQYNDEYELKVQQQKEDAITDRLIIQSCRDISLEYAKNQPKIINNYNKIYTW